MTFDAASHAPRAFLVKEGGQDDLTFSFSHVAGQSGLSGQVDVSEDLADWSSGPGEIIELLPAVVNDNGSITRTYRLPTPVTDSVKSFLRLRVDGN